MYLRRYCLIRQSRWLMTDVGVEPGQLRSRSGAGSDEQRPMVARHETRAYVPVIPISAAGTDH